MPQAGGECFTHDSVIVGYIGNSVAVTDEVGVGLGCARIKLLELRKVYPSLWQSGLNFGRERKLSQIFQLVLVGRPGRTSVSIAPRLLRGSVISFLVGHLFVLTLMCPVPFVNGSFRPILFRQVLCTIDSAAARLIIVPNDYTHALLSRELMRVP